MHVDALIKSYVTYVYSKQQELCMHVHKLKHTALNTGGVC